MNQLVNGIEEQFTYVLNQHENDFLNAYKGHMSKVTQELNFLKNRAAEANGKLLNDDSINSLQKNIEWFKSEAINLDQKLEDQKEELAKFKAREANLQQDKTFLEEQVKEQKRHNKMVKIAVQKTKEQSLALR